LYPIIDTHCDALYQLWKNPNQSYVTSQQLHTSVDRLRSGGVQVQSYALYLPASVPLPTMFYEMLRCVDLFHKKVVQEGGLKVIGTAEDLSRLESNQRGALLTVEGLDALVGDTTYFRTLYYLGVRSVGLTWNTSNLAADGVGESRGAGLTEWGKEIIRECNDLHMMIDVSHLPEKGFWDVMEVSQKPVYASHSNVYELCPHPRNLRKPQIEALIRTGGRIGLTFVPMFIDPESATMDALLQHVEKVCEWGGAAHLGFGSDFDGITSTVPGLEHSGCYTQWVELLLKHYSEEWVKRWLYGNWHDFYMDQLPRES
jgi:membrane dipeptidase